MTKRIFLAIFSITMLSIAFCNNPAFADDNGGCTGPAGTCGNGGDAVSRGGDATALLSTRSLGWAAIDLTNPASYPPGMTYNATTGVVTFPGAHTAHTNIASVSYTVKPGATVLYVQGAIAQKSGTLNGRYYQEGQFITPTMMGATSDPSWRTSRYGGYGKESPYSLSYDMVRSMFESAAARGDITPAELQNFLEGNTLGMMALWDGYNARGAMEPWEYNDGADLSELLKTFSSPPEPAPTADCGDYLHWGDTYGEVKVINLTTGVGWVPNDYVWARPGDSVRFAIDYCWGAQAVRGWTNSNLSRWADTEANYFQITASPSNLYFFGEHDIKGGVRYTLKTHESDARAATGISYFDKDWPWKFQVFSPSNKSPGNYNCQIFDFSPYFATYGFQIPGATTQCAASGLTGNGSGWENVGSEITQTLTYDEITAWQIYKHWETGECKGVCDHYENGACPPSDNGERPRDDYDTLRAHNGNATSPYKHLADALAGSGDAQQWGRVQKYWDNAMHGYSRADAVCDASGNCAPSSWSMKHPNAGQPIWGSKTVNGVSTPTITGYYPDRMKCGPCDRGKDGWKVDSYAGTYWHYPYIDYTTDTENLGTKSPTAGVKIPFNFMTATTSNIIGATDGVVYIGEEVSSNFSASILPRLHAQVHPGEAYATIVPAEIKAVEFIVREDTDMNGMGGSSNAGGQDPCAFFTKYMIDPSDCPTIWSVGSPLNPDGRYTGKTYTSFVDDRTVPDLEKYPVGSKYCVAVGISISDSHSRPDDTSPVDGMQSFSGWRISGASCRTMAKKPNFQVWNGGVYTNGSISTINSKKDTGSGFGDYSPDSIFGSWAEYYVVAAGEVSGFASGAASGYYGKERNTSLGLRGGSYPDVSNCEYTRMTIANDDCDSGLTGNSSVRNISQDVVLERIRSRYTRDDITDTENRGIILSNGARYVKKKGNFAISDFISAISSAVSTADATEKSCVLSANTSVALKRCKGQINSESEQTTSNYASNTLIIHITGTLTIDRNICDGNGTCNTSRNTIRLGSNNDEKFTNLYSLPQVLLIADGGIKIRNDVTQVDAWLITNGHLDTCEGFALGVTTERDCKSTLIINGPVFASSVTLGRTGGAYYGTGTEDTSNVLYKELTNDGSITPGEIFNLRPDTYLWAYSQAQRFSQANVTYTRELAPRY